MRCVRYVLVSAVGLLACEREARRFAELAPLAVPVESARSSTHARRMEARTPDPLDYEESAFAVAEGKRLFTWFNCTGCHGQGGGGSGPALMDAAWRYGSEPGHIYTTLVEGRANGMPSFRGKLPAQQVWQLVAYVRALGGLVRLDVAPSRGDILSPHKPEVMEVHNGVVSPRPERVHP